ncbi:hypothetical protein F01_290054 [Burkholderia cenocepacia]|nr:hypothetical protein F01_290054 [Burkholderia cenocepacia]
MRARGGRGHANRRRAARVHAAGRAGGGRAERVDATVDGRAARRAVRAVRSVGRHRARVSHRLADELLDHRAVGARVRREPVATQLIAARRIAARCRSKKTPACPRAAPAFFHALAIACGAPCALPACAPAHRASTRA